MDAVAARECWELVLGLEMAIELSDRVIEGHLITLFSFLLPKEENARATRRPRLLVSGGNEGGCVLACKLMCVRTVSWKPVPGSWDEWNCCRFSTWLGWGSNRG